MKDTKVRPEAATVRVAIYARLSLDHQGNELGIDRQVNECREWADAHGMTVVEVYTDNDISATKGLYRAGFEATLRDLPGTGVAVLCWHTDRYIRVTSELERVIDTGLTVYAKHAGHIDLSTPAGRAVARTVTAWATYEGEQKSLRQKSSHSQARRSGQPFHGGIRPLGYDKAIINGVRTYVINEREAPYVRELYDRFLKGHTLSGLADWLDDEGVRSTYPPTEGDRPWKHTSVRQILAAPRYAGIVTYNGEEMGEGNWTALVSEATYRAVVRQLEDPGRHTGGPRKGRNGLVHPLIGVIVCGICEDVCRVFSGHSMREQRGFACGKYICPNGHGSVQKEWIEQIVDAQVLTRLTGPITTSLNQQTDVDLNAVHAELADLRNYADELGKMLGKRKMTLGQFTDANAVVQADIERLERQVAASGLDEALVSLLDVEDLESHWSTMDAAEKNRFLRAFYEKIVIVPRPTANVDTGSCRGHAILVSRQDPGNPWEVRDEGVEWSYSAAEARAWCREKGYDVSRKGRIPYEWRMEFEQAMAG